MEHIPGLYPSKPSERCRTWLALPGSEGLSPLSQRSSAGLDLLIEAAACASQFTAREKNQNVPDVNIR